MENKKRSLLGLFGRQKEKTAQIAKRAYAKGYSDAGASLTRRSLKSFIAQSGSPIEDIDLNNKTLRQRGRMLYMASPIASAAVNTTRTKVVGAGLRMRPAVDRAVLGLSDTAITDWQKKTEAEWRLWAERCENCDALGMNNFSELQQIAVKSWLMSGDIFALFQRREKTAQNPYTLRLQLVEADRVCTPTMGKGVFSPFMTEGIAENGNKIHDGVEVDTFGRVTAYHICSAYPGQIYAADPTWTRVEARGARTGIPNILHVMDAERPDQYRGVTFIAPVIEMLLQLRRYTEAELMAALVQTYLTAWITTETGDNFDFNEVGAGEIAGVPGDQPDNISQSPNEYEMGPGTVNYLAPGENVTLGNPNIPTAGFESFVKTLCRMTGASFELPYDVLIKEFNSSYSAAKGALEEAWEMFKMRRAWFVADFCQPVYEAWLSEAVATGRIKAPGFFTDPAIRAAWCGARWDGPAQTHLDPVKEANANILLVDRGWKTNEQVTREFYGGSFEDNAEQIAHEREIFTPGEGKTKFEEDDDEKET